MLFYSHSAFCRASIGPVLRTGGFNKAVQVTKKREGVKGLLHGLCTNALMRCLINVMPGGSSEKGHGGSVSDQ